MLYFWIKDQAPHTLIKPAATDANIETFKYNRDPNELINKAEEPNIAYSTLGGAENGLVQFNYGTKYNQLSTPCSNNFSPFCNYNYHNIQSKYPNFQTLQYPTIGFESQSIYQRPAIYQQTTSMLPPQYNPAFNSNVVYNGYVFDRLHLSQMPYQKIQSLISLGYLPPNYIHQSQSNYYQQGLQHKELQQQALEHQQGINLQQFSSTLQENSPFGQIPACSPTVASIK